MVIKALADQPPFSVNSSFLKPPPWLFVLFKQALFCLFKKITGIYIRINTKNIHITIWR